MTEMTAKDAPVWYSAEQADAWANGFNAAREIIPPQRTKANEARAAAIAKIDEIEKLDTNGRYGRLAREAMHFLANETIELHRDTAPAGDMARGYRPGLTYGDGYKRGMADTFGAAAPQPRPSWESLTAIIRPMIESVCSDGNSDAARLAKDIADAILMCCSAAKQNTKENDDGNHHPDNSVLHSGAVSVSIAAARRDEIVAGAFYKTRGDKNNLPSIVGPLEHADDGDAPWKAHVHGQTWVWGYDGLANADGSPHNRDLVERVYRPEARFPAGMERQAVIAEVVSYLESEGHGIPAEKVRARFGVEA